MIWLGFIIKLGFSAGFHFWQGNQVLTSPNGPLVQQFELINAHQQYKIDIANLII